MDETKRLWNLNYQELLKSIKQKPSNFLIFLGIIGLGFALLLSGNDKGGSQNQTTPQLINEKENMEIPSTIASRQQLEAELTKTLESITGAGKVKIELNLRSGSRKVWERQTHIDKRVSQEQGAINTQENNSDELVIAKSQDGRETPILKEELAPVIEGVIVVASGATNPRIKELLTNAVMTILGLPAHRVIVVSGEIREEIKP